MIFFILFSYCFFIVMARRNWKSIIFGYNNSTIAQTLSEFSHPKNNLFAVGVICRFIKMESCPTTLTPVTKTHQVGCDSSAVPDTEKNRTSFPSSTVEISTTGLLERFPWERNFSYGMTKNIPRIWEYHWRCKIWRLWTPTVCHYGDEAT